MGDNLHQCIKRGKNGGVSAVKSMQQYYRIKPSTFKKKPFNHNGKPYPFKELLVSIKDE
jgi:hypothetical protein